MAIYMHLIVVLFQPFSGDFEGYFSCSVMWIPCIHAAKL